MSPKIPSNHVYDTVHGDAVGGEGPDPAPHEEPEDQQRSGRSQVSILFHT